MSSEEKKGVNKPLIIGLSVAGLIVLFVISFWMYGMGVKSDFVKLKFRYDAQFNEVETTLDNMIKTIKNQAKVKDSFAKDFIAVVMAQAEGRKGGSLLKMQNESANMLGITPELYTKLQNSIAGELDQFKRSQDTLTDVWRQYNTFCENPWHNILWLSYDGKIKDKPVMISGGKAKKAIETKELDDDLL